MEVRGKVVRWGNSQGLRVTKEILSQLGWNRKQAVSMEVAENGTLIIKPESNDLESLFKDYVDDGVREPLLFSDDVGQEIL